VPDAFGNTAETEGADMDAEYRVLLVDDVADLRLMLRLNLEGSGQFRVLAEAANGFEGVELARQHHPDLVLLDIAMPLQDGMKALPQIREASPDSRVVILSSFEEQRYGERAMQLGASAYVEKTLAPDALVAKLVDVMEANLSP
jgi:DNA-binding NarL/FixJ family response regulator